MNHDFRKECSRLNKQNTLVVNLFGGPGAGKSTGAAYIFSKLKQRGIDAELVTEFAKDIVWENNLKALDCQLYISGHQAYRIARCCGNVDVVITDSPIILGCLYHAGEFLKKALIEEFKKYNNINYLISRVKPFNPNGRVQTESESRVLDAEISKLLRESNIEYSTKSGNEAGYDEIVEEIINILNNPIKEN